MKPQNLKTKIFLDGGDPKETKEIIDLLGFLDGQTTNPTLISKNPEAQKRLADGNKFTNKEIFTFYKDVVREVSPLIPDGSVSVEVYADEDTSSQKMIEQGRDMFSWIPNAHIKLPITAQGLIAADTLTKEGMRVNMTLCFTQSQAAAVYAATKSVGKGDVFVSPFVGRLDDKGENGMSLIANILKMYKESDGHVEVLVASVRSMEHFLYALALGVDIITAPAKILRAWHENGLMVPGEDFVYQKNDLADIAYQDFDIQKSYQDFDIAHELTDNGIVRFAQDWNALIK